MRSGNSNSDPEPDRFAGPGPEPWLQLQLELKLQRQSYVVYGIGLSEVDASQEVLHLFSGLNLHGACNQISGGVGWGPGVGLAPSVGSVGVVDKCLTQPGAGQPLTGFRKMN